MTHEQHANTNNGYKHCSWHKKTVLQSAQTKLWKKKYWWEAISLK